MPDVAAQERPGQRLRHAQALGVGQRLAGQRQVDRQCRLLRRSRSRRRCARRRRAAPPRRRPPSPPPRGRRSCRRPAARPAGRRSTRPARPAAAAASASPSSATVAPGRAARARSRSANATSGWKLPSEVPAAIAGCEHARRQGAAGVDERLAAVQRQAARRCRRRRRRARSGRSGRPSSSTALRLGEGARAGHQRRETSPALLVAAGDGGDRPAGAREGDGERRPDVARADEGDARPAVVRVVLMRRGRARRAVVGAALPVVACSRSAIWSAVGQPGVYSAVRHSATRGGHPRQAPLQPRQLVCGDEEARPR